MVTQAKKSNGGGRPRDGLGRLLPASNSPEAKRRRRNQTAEAEQRIRERDERRAEAYNLRLAGHSYPEIMNRMPGRYTDPRHVHTDVEAHRQLMATARSEDELQEALDRNDTLRAAMWDAAIQGDSRAAGVVIRLEERRARLLGLDQPLRHSLGGDSQAQPIAIEDARERLLRRVLRVIDA